MDIQSLPVASSFLRSAETHLSKKAFNRLKRLIIEDYQGFLSTMSELIENKHSE